MKGYNGIYSFNTHITLFNHKRQKLKEKHLFMKYEGALFFLKYNFGQRNT